MGSQPLISIVIPAFNEAEGLQRILPQIHSLQLSAEIIVVDDGSIDNTSLVAHHFGARIIRLPYNRGNGAAIKAGVRTARGKFLVIMDADGQHQPNDIPRFLNELEQGYDLVVGARSPDSHANLSRRLANLGFNILASWMVGYKIPDLTSGFRATHTHLLKEFLHLFPNGFSTPVTSTLAYFRAGYTVQYLSIQALPRIGKSHIRPIKDGFRFLLIIYKIAALYSPLKVFLPICGFILCVSMLYQGTAQTILLLAATMTFLMGLIAEQITMIMYKEKRSHDEDFD